MFAGVQGWHLLLVVVVAAAVLVPILVIRGAAGRSASGSAAPIDATGPTNVLAVLSLVLSFFVSIAAVVCGHIALAQIHRSGERGRGIAVAGLSIGYAGMVLGALTAITLFFVLGAS
ncbi:DUF4190 domain-containing protein [Rathayibacter sp. VKM Ac-2857]|uniref:DUF4190 domain-containing protein n=1 Tax=Rathayibacter sp. VKM Ac-2857 TaxID=2739020 RepID=UPI0015666EF5|nr:DUF4190 domain-containing protein [Rathayibacter sp. VKM Ac-2857]NQX16047.1 DUF4190 domain-containing protein [Rathayibacter sp. VKM Ac-2857]